jgi:hypothetical protein
MWNLLVGIIPDKLLETVAQPPAGPFADDQNE